MIRTKEKKNKFYAVILAAGKGTRMESNLPKVLHEIGGKTLLQYVLDATESAGAEKIIVVIGHQAQKVSACFPESRCVFVLQEHQLGTGHAVLQARNELAHYDGLTVILCGDVPLLKTHTIKKMIDEHLATNATLTVLTAIVPDAFSYGRIIKDGQGAVIKITEQADAKESEKMIKEINTGIYCVQTPFLLEALEKIENKNSKKEYYLTDIVEIARNQNFKVHACVTDNYVEVMGINTPEELANAARYLKN
jgi:UDP-N-acetylglucosamine diphosphorylase/glucosamine-1-phosphate N-acetyltransferase